MVCSRVRLVITTGAVALMAALPSRADLLEDLTRMPRGHLERASSGLFDPESNADCHHVYPGQRLLLADLRGPGEIRHIWFTLASRDRRYPRNVVLRAYWDGSEVPAIETPIGDFFAAGNGMRANVDSIPVAVSSYGRALNCYWRMPFRERAVLELENQGTERVSVYFQCEWVALDELPDDVLYFHARYRQEYPAKPLSPYVVFEGQGAGQYVGTVYSSQNLVASWFGEADDRFYVDGEAEPSIVGTGTEDYFNDAWNLRVHTYGHKGVTICDRKGAEQRVTAYRWHLADPIVFRRSLRVEMERRSFVNIPDPETGKGQEYDFKYRPDYVSSVAFWYQRGTAPRMWGLPPARERLLPEIWVEPAELVDKVRASEGLKAVVAANRTCHQKRFLYVRNDALGGWIELPFEVADGGRYVVSVFQSLFRTYGVWRVSLLGPEGTVVLDPALDFFDPMLAREQNWPENWHHGTLVETKLGEVRLQPGSHAVRFECVGSNPQSLHPDTKAFGQGFSLGLDAVNLRRLPLEPAEWLAAYLPAEEGLYAERDAEAAERVGRLVLAVDDARRRQGHYPRGVPDAGLDPWGQPYQYRCPGVVHPWGFDLWSWRGDSRRAARWIGNWTAQLDLAREAPAGAVVIEGESMQPVGLSRNVGVTPQQAEALVHAPLSSGGQLLINMSEQGQWVELAPPAPIAAGGYDAYLFHGMSWDYGVFRWSLAGGELSPPIDAYSERLGMGSAGPLRASIGADGVVLRIEVLNKNGRSAGYRVGIDAVVLVPVGEKRR